MTEREDILKALRRAYQLGQTYWQQADSESWRQNAKSRDTSATFNQLVCDVDAILLKADGKPEPVAARSKDPLEAAGMTGAVALAAPVAQKPLTDGQIEALGHRIATKYTHRSDPASHSYGFVRHTLIDFARAIEKHGTGGD